jgi:3-dehydroquinate synthase
MLASRRIVVRTPSGSYSVLCGSGTLSRTGREVARLGERTGIFFLSSRRVWRHWGRRFEGDFRIGNSQTILFDDPETSKTLATVERLCRQLVRAGADRRAVIVAVGGGVVGDVAGFVAASYLRGVQLVLVPTTLVAQVDSAIGGKTGVNLPEGKNLVGAFYQPQLVIADPEALRTLAFRQYRSGLYEVVKYGVIGDPALFVFLERNLDDLLRRKSAALGWVLPRCIRAKAEIVRRDERESGLREILNFGHTVGHALESVTGYSRFLHGEAIGWGMMAATLIAVVLDRLDPRAAARILRLVSRVGPLPDLPRVTAVRLLVALRRDKKTRGGRLRFVLPRCIGRVEVVADVPEALVREVLAELPRLAKQAT